MADISQSNWSPTDASNTSAAPDGAPEGMAPSGVNDVLRAHQGALKRFHDLVNGTLTTGGTTTAYTLTPTVAPAAYFTGMLVSFKVNATNTGASTLNISTLGAKDIYKQTTAGPAAIAAGDLVINQIAQVIYDGTRFQLVSPIGVASFSGGTLTSTLVMSGAAINEAAGSDIASAGTTDIGAATGNYVNVTGTTTITALGTVQAGTRRIVRFAGALTLTHNATSLILPSGANITTAAGDVAQFVSLGSGNWRCVGYMKADGTAVVSSGQKVVQIVNATPYTANTNLTTTIPYDDSIPQNTEGTQILTLTITPTSASNKVRLRFSGFGSASTTEHITAALFVNSTANAIFATMTALERDSGAQTDRPSSISFEFEHSPGTTSATTYSVRVGGPGGTIRMNGTSSGRLFGGVAACTLIAEEVAT